MQWNETHYIFCFFFIYLPFFVLWSFPFLENEICRGRIVKTCPPIDLIIIGKLRMILTALTRERVAIKALTFSWPNLKINPKKYKEESIARRREIIKKKRHLRVLNLYTGACWIRSYRHVVDSRPSERRADPFGRQGAATNHLNLIEGEGRCVSVTSACQVFFPFTLLLLL